jgi:phosphatidylglycerophosphatase A
VGFAPRKTWQKVAKLLGTGFGAGYIPLMPGTIGSLWGLPLVWLIQRLFKTGTETFEASVAFSACALVIVLAGVAICHRARHEFEGHDPKQIVFDEIAAFPIVFLFVKIGWATAIYGFIWFRLFDITKPWPIKRIEKLPGGLGIMADDFVAGVYAAAALMFTINAKELLQRLSET